MKKLLFSLRNVSVKLNQIIVFKDVFIDIFENDITSLIYENEIEKEALLLVLNRHIPVDSGIYYVKKEWKNHPDEYLWVIGEKSNLFEGMSLGDQIFGLGTTSRKLITRNYDKQFRNLMDIFEINIPCGKKVEDLTKLESIQIEIMMAFVLKKKCIILYSLSMILSASEINRIWAMIKIMKEKGYSFIILDNYENFLHRRADRVYIVKSGHVVQCLTGKDVTKDKIYLSLKNKQIENLKPHQEILSESREILFRFDHAKTEEFDDLNFKIYKGQIYKFLYEDRRVAQNFANIFQGSFHLTEGRICYEDKEFSVVNYEDALNKKIGFVPINPIGNQLFQELSVKMNLFYPVSRKTPEVLRYLRFEKNVKQMLKEEIPPEIYNVKIKSLNPFMQMSVVYGKWFLYCPKILICMNPFPNYNIEMDRVIEKWMIKMVDRGTAILILASSWPSHLSLKCKDIYNRTL